MSSFDQTAFPGHFHNPHLFNAPPLRTPRLLRTSRAKENAMVHFMYSLLLVGAFVLIIGMVYGARTLLQNRRNAAAPFRNYFSTEYDRDLLRYSALSEDEEWLADCRPRSSSSLPRDSSGREY
jgi:hypothetical protein